MTAASNQALIARNVTVRFGGLTALSEVDLALEKGEIVGLIGANGAGKSTLINVLSGFQSRYQGEVTLRGRRLSGTAPETIARAGVVRTFQAVRLFGGLSVFENVAAAAAVSAESSDFVDRLLDLLSLQANRDRLAGTLSYANQRRLGIARALALKPDFLLLDEPAAGMSPEEVEDTDLTLVRVREQNGIGILLVEHNMALVMGVCERLVVLDSGRVIARGTPGEIQNDPKVRAAYLGVEAGA